MNKKYIILIILLGIIALAFLIPSSKKLNISYQQVALEQQFSTKNTTLKVFVENSGSMKGYTCPGAEFKDAIKSYLSSLEFMFKNVELNYINTKIIPRTNDIKQFVEDLTPQKFTNVGGNIQNTDLGTLIDNVINLTNDTVVSIFISDCILDVHHDPTKYFTSQQIDIRNSVRKLMSKGNFSVEILQLQSLFEGYYYGVDGTRKIKANRPYYMWIFGQNELLSKMNQESPLQDIKHGVENCASFSKHQIIPFEIKNKFGREVRDVHAKRNEYEILINANFNGLLKSDQELTDISNFNFLNSQKAFVTSIQKNKYESQYTHVISVSIKQDINSCAEKLSFYQGNNDVSWANNMNDDSGKDIENHLDKTTGIKYLVNGVKDAFKDVKSLGEINFVIKNN